MKINNKILELGRLQGTFSENPIIQINTPKLEKLTDLPNITLSGNSEPGSFPRPAPLQAEAEERGGK